MASLSSSNTSEATRSVKEQRLFLRATLDPETDLIRGFSGVYNSWVDHKDQIEEAVLETYPEGGKHLLPPRQDPVTGWWCWEPEAGLSAFGFSNEEEFIHALKKVTPYGEHLDRIAVFSSYDYNVKAGADREDLFRNGHFLGWIPINARFHDVQKLIKSFLPEHTAEQHLKA
jgi:hypothetical protein